MPEIPEETLQYWEENPCDLHCKVAIAEIRRLRELLAERDGQIAALVDVVTRYHEALPSPESTTTLANLSEAAAKAHDKRLKAEGAAEALDALAVYWTEEGWNGGLFFQEIARIYREGADSFGAAVGIREMRHAEAARLREEAGR